MKELIVIFLSTRKYYLSFFECGNYGVMWFFFHSFSRSIPFNNINQHRREREGSLLSHPPPSEMPLKLLA